MIKLGEIGPIKREREYEPISDPTYLPAAPVPVPVEEPTPVVPIEEPAKEPIPA